MKILHKFLIIQFMSFAFITTAQESLDRLIITVKRSNKSLISAKEQNSLTKNISRTELNPDNPEVELGYLIGNPNDIGNRTDFSVSQSFDFPTAYINKRKSAKVVRNQADIELKIAEQEIIADAKKVWIEKVFLNQKQQIISKRLLEAEKLKKQYERKFILGEINKLEVNKVNLYTSLLRNEYDKVELELHKNKYAIIELCGGNSVSINDTIFPTATIVLPDSIVSAYDKSPEKELFEEQLKLAKVEKSVVLSNKLPKITLGYYSEKVGSESFKGFKIGLSIPLWENRNATKKVKSEILFAEADLDRFKNYQNSKVQQLLERVEHIQKQIKDLSGSLVNINDGELLTKALNAGEISLTEYYYQSDFYFRSLILLLEMQKEQLQLEADILKVFEN